MKRSLALLFVLGFACPAFAAAWNTPGTLGAGSCAAFILGASDAGNAQPGLRVPAGELAFTAVATNGTAMSVSFYELPIGVVDDADPAAETGTRLVATMTGTSSAPTKVETNGGILDVDIDTDGDGGSVKVCSASYAMAKLPFSGRLDTLANSTSTSETPAANEWSRVWRDLRTEAALVSSWGYRSATASTSADLDARSCTAGVGMRWDPSVNDNTNVTRGSIYACPTRGVALGSCGQTILLGDLAAYPLSPWDQVGNDARLSLAAGPFLRVVLTTAPTGGDIAGVQLDCFEASTPKQAWQWLLHDDMDHTVLNFRNKRDVSCASATCGANDTVAPVWIRTAISAPIADTFVLDSAVGQSGQAILDPGTAASTGVQYTMPAAASLVLDYDDLGRLPGNAVLFEATFWRSGTTVIPAIGLCPISAADAATLALTTTGAFANAIGGVKWDAAGTFTARWGTTDITTVEVYEGNYHTVTIRTRVRNVNLDLSGLFQPKGFGDIVDTMMEIDGIPVVSLDTAGAFFTVSTNQISPCLAAVNVGGTADTVNITEVQWHTSKIHARANEAN
jgi:hypothetical protein